jgi:hypothetical protein
MQQQEMSDEEIARTALEFYETRLKPLLEPHRNGDHVAVCLDDGDYEVAETGLEADRRLRVRHPNAVFVLMQVGKPIMDWPWVGHHGVTGKP